MSENDLGNLRFLCYFLLAVLVGYFKINCDQFVDDIIYLSFLLQKGTKFHDRETSPSCVFLCITVKHIVTTNKKPKHLLCRGDMFTHSEVDDTLRNFAGETYPNIQN